MTIQREHGKTALNELTFDEAMKTIRRIREERKIYKIDPVKKRAASKAHKVRKTRVEKHLENLTPEQLMELAAKYGVKI